jgi:exodeoxyribonuclease VII small subunit
MTTPKATPDFEEAIKRLETIVAQMEGDKLPLNDLLVRYEEGMNLVKLCTEQLAQAEKRIEIITRTAAGEARLAPFEEAAKPEIQSPAPGKAAPERSDVSLF